MKSSYSSWKNAFAMIVLTALALQALVLTLPKPGQYRSVGFNGCGRLSESGQ